MSSIIRITTLDMASEANSKQIRAEIDMSAHTFDFKHNVAIMPVGISWVDPHDISRLRGHKTHLHGRIAIDSNGWRSRNVAGSIFRTGGMKATDMAQPLLPL